MPIQAAANRLKMEIEGGKTRSIQPVAAPVTAPAPKAAAKPEEKKGKPKGNEKKAAAPVVERVPPTQYEILMQIGITEEEIPKFKDA